MNVYLVKMWSEGWDWESLDIVHVASTLEKAQAFIDERASTCMPTNSRKTSFSIDEMTVDE